MSYEFLENPESTPSEGICPARKLFETLLHMKNETESFTGLEYDKITAEVRDKGAHKLVSFFNCPSETGIAPLRLLLDMSLEN